MTASAEPHGAAPLGVELLDDPNADPAAVRAQLRDIARLNRWFGGTRAVVRAVEPLFRRFPGPARWTLLDVGTGGGDIPGAVTRTAHRYGIELTALGLERSPAAARVARTAGVHTTIGDGNAIPFRPRAADVVVASQVLHHLPRDTARRWLQTLDTLARRAVIVADLQRSRPAMAGVWLAAAVLGMSRSTRHDAVLSLRRGYKKEELQQLLAEAGIQGRVSSSPWFRLVATWDVLPPGRG